MRENIYAISSENPEDLDALEYGVGATGTENEVYQLTYDLETPSMGQFIFFNMNLKNVSSATITILDDNNVEQISEVCIITQLVWTLLNLTLQRMNKLKKTISYIKIHKIYIHVTT